MRTHEEIISKLKEHQSPTPSKWREKAEWRRKNRTWLRYSQHIAMMMLDKMEELHLSQKQLSELMGCSQQYVSKVLKEQENLSLETISKIESCLDLQIMPRSPYHYAYASDTEKRITGTVLLSAKTNSSANISFLGEFTTTPRI